MATKRDSIFVLLALCIPIAVALHAPARSLVAPCPTSMQDEVRMQWMPAEGSAQTQAALSFPGDRWSTGDDFHNTESRFLRALAQRHSVPVGCAVLAMHEALRADPEQVARRVIAPCKPRPFYD